MDNLFTVDYALNYEGWKYVKNIAPYNVYQLDQFIIRVRRNDFYLVLFIYNKCQELVFCGRIYTINDYNLKIKRHLTKWKCKLVTNVTPTPPTQGLVINNNSYSNNFLVGGVVNSLVTNTFNEDFNFITNINVGGLTFSKVGSNINVTGTPTTVGNYSNTVLIQGVITGVILNIVVNITITSFVPVVSTFITQEDGGRIIIQEDNGFLITE
jgi:hypothetical protein